MTPRRPCAASRRAACDAGLARGRPSRSPRSSAVAARYAVAITPAMAELIDPADPDDPIARQFVPDPAELVAPAAGARRSDRRRRPQPGRGHRPPLSRPGAAQARPRLRGLLPVLLPPRDGRARAARRAVAGRRSTPRSPISAPIRQIWEVILTGGDPLVLSPRRLRKVVARARRDRPRQGHPLPHPRAGRGDPERITAELVDALEGARQGDLCRAPRQPSARTDAGARARPARGSSMPAFRC